MPRCEMCGEDDDELHTAKVSGAELDVCDNCVRFGTRLDEDDDDDEETTSTKYSTGNTGRNSQRSQQNNEPMPGTRRLAMDYGQQIRGARESAGYSVEELSDKLNEKASHLRKIEREERQPDNNLQAKIEDFLGLDLTMGETPSRGDMDLDSGGR